jgi:plastocyanin
MIKIDYSLSKIYPLKLDIALACLFLFILSLLTLLPINSALSIVEEGNKTNKQSSVTRQPLQIISNIRILLNQIIDEYKQQNYTGAQDLATKAYLDNFEFIEAPLLKLDKSLKQNTELMLREQLRQLIKDKVPFENIQKLVNNINGNLNQAEKILSGSNNRIPSYKTAISANNQSYVNTTERGESSANSTHIVKLTTSADNKTNESKEITVKPATISKNKVLIGSEESDNPFSPSPINASVGDTIKWINTDAEIHTVTSGSPNNSSDSGKEFDSGNLNPSQIFEHTFSKAGTYHYFCIIHPSMLGLVDVK